MSDSNVIVINPPKKEKRSRGRPKGSKSIKNVNGAKPDITQQFRQFKEITEPQLLENVDIQDDLVAQIKEALGQTSGIDVEDTFKEGYSTVETFGYSDPIRAQSISNENKMIKEKLLRDQKKQADFEKQEAANKLKEMAKIKEDKKEAAEILAKYMRSKVKKYKDAQLVDTYINDDKKNASSQLQAAIKRKLNSNQIDDMRRKEILSSNFS
jgi:hypothetical protein